jgi:hypothetical protein
MNATQKVVTGLIAILMLGTILMMPAQMPGDATSLKRTGAVGTPAQASTQVP